MRQPAYDMGHEAARVLFDLLEGKEHDTRDPLPADVRIRDSVSVPKEHR